MLGFTGPKAEAEEIKERLATFLRDELALELSTEKTLITHARTRAARFLGYDIITQTGGPVRKGRRATSGVVGLRVPKDVIRSKAAPYFKRGQPAHRSEWINENDHAIVATYGAIYRGIVQYCLLAADVYRWHRLNWVMSTSMLKTLAAKHSSTVTKMARKHRAKTETPHGLRRCFEARIEREGRSPLVARFGGIPLVKDLPFAGTSPRSLPCGDGSSWQAEGAHRGRRRVTGVVRSSRREEPRATLDRSKGRQAWCHTGGER